MRHYPVNSPMASARLVALSATAQGRLTRAQMEAIRERGFIQQLGLAPSEWHEVLNDLLMDLLPLRYSSWSSALKENSPLLDQVLSEIDDARLQRRIFGISAALAEIESSLPTQDNPVITAAQRRWDLTEQAAAAPATDPAATQPETK